MRSHRTNARSAVAIAPEICFSTHLALLLILLLALLSAMPTHGQTEPATPAPSQSKTPPQSQASSQQSSQTSSQPSTQAPSPATLQTVPGDKPQSLADAARQANAQKDKPKAKRVYTADDLAGIHGNISVVGDRSPRGSANDGDADDDSNERAPSQSNSNEAYWRSRARDIKDRIASTDQQIASVKAEIAKAGPASFDPSSGLSQGVIIVHDRNAEVKQLEDRKAGLERQLDELADEARKAGADSGWTR